MYEIDIQNGSSTQPLSVLDVNSACRVASGSFTEEVNAIPSFTFKVYPQNPCYDALHEAKTHINIRNALTGEVEFEGRVLNITSTMSGSGVVGKSVICEGLLAYLCDSCQPYAVYENTDAAAFLQAVLANHNAICPEKPIDMGMCDIHGTAQKMTNYGTTLEEIKRNLTDVLGGEIRLRRQGAKLYLDYLQQYGVTCSARVELARNLQDLSVECNAASIITRLIPLGAKLPDTEERLTIAAANNGCIYIDDAAAMQKYGVICGTAEFDDVTGAAELMGHGKEYLRQNNRVKKSYRGTVLDLSTIGRDAESFRAGNTYHFWNPLLSVDEPLRILKRAVDIYKPYKPTVTIGDKLESMTDLAVKNANYIQYEFPKRESAILAQAKANASALIQAGINGFVVVNPNEILIMDTPDKSTASKVWRWNSGGFGYSSTGYDGEYGTAITMDGAIVADYITAGILRGIEISNGDGTFHVDEDGTVRADAIEITGGRINIDTDSESESIIKLNYAVNSAETLMELSPFGLVVVKTTGSTSSGLIATYGQLDLLRDGTNVISLNASNGSVTAESITAGKITASGDGVLIPKTLSSGGQTLYSVGQWFLDIENRLTALEG